MRRLFAAGCCWTLLLLAWPAVAQDGWVVLPVAEYRTLRDRAFPPPRPSEPPPVEAALTRIEYELTTAGDSAVGEARLIIDVLKDGWVKVPIPAGLLVREARLDGRPISLVEGQKTGDAKSRPDAAPYMLLPRSGRQIVLLEMAAPLVRRNGLESLSLPASQAPVQRTTLTLRGPDVDLSVTGGAIAERTPTGSRAQADQSVRFVVYGRAGDPLNLTWGRQRTAPAGQPLRLRGRVVESVGLGEDSTQITAEVTVDVTQGQTESIRASLPAGLSIDQVSGPLVADWQTRSDLLEISLLEPVDRTVSVTIVAEARLPRDGQFDIPILRVVDAEREAGGVAVEVLGAGEIQQQSLKGLDPADPTDLGDGVASRRSPALVAFRFLPGDSRVERCLTVSLVRYTEQAVLLANVEEARYQMLATEDGKMLVDARFAVRNTERSFLTVALPSGAVFWSAAVNGRPVRPGRSAAGAFLVPILRGRGENAPVMVIELLYLDRGTAWQAGSRFRVSLPSLDLPASRTGFNMYFSPRYRVTLDPGSTNAFRIESYEPPESAALRFAPPPGLAPAVAAPREAENLKGSNERKALGLAGPSQAQGKDDRDAELSTLINRFQRGVVAGRVLGILPVALPFPALGPSLYLASELTPEGTAPEIRFLLKETTMKGAAR